jgi:hypothetical protein
VNLSSDDRFTLTTPHFTVSVPRSARFRIDSGPDGGTVAVHKGDVDVEAMGAPYRVTKNRAFLFRVEGDQVTLARAPEADGWDRWVENRENILNASHEAISTRYARTSFSYGMYDLDYYGGWYNVPGYGRCWQPRSIGFGWSPYSFGQWVWLAGYGMTWVSFEPWGWTPYHYGNWVYLPGGWYWVPGGFNYWRPALVYWVNLGNNQWGWGPRHPHDLPGQPPNNLPHGTVLTTNNTPTGYGGVDRRLQRATPGDIARAQVLAEPPESFVGARFRGRGATATGGVDSTATSGATSTSGYAGTTKTPPTQPGDVAREDGITPRTRGSSAETGKASGIVYDPQGRRWVNADVPGRAGTNARTNTTETPATPAANGYSGTTATPAQTPATPSTEIRPVDRGDVARDDSRLPGRREQKDGTPAQMRPPQTPRSEAQQPQRPSTAPPSQVQPRVETPRSAPQQQPRWESPSRPASPPPPAPPRVEPMHPASPPPAPAPRSESGGRPQTKPPGHN